MYMYTLAYCVKTNWIKFDKEYITHFDVLKSRALVADTSITPIWMN
jgi:hypothetical protein